VFLREEKRRGLHALLETTFAAGNKKEVRMKMPIIDRPFKDREDVKAEIRKCDLFGSSCQYACFIFAALGVIGDASNITLGLEPMSWFLLAIVAGLNAIIGHTHVMVAKHLLGIEGESKKGSIELLKQ
jgi:hypothetical protein